MFSRSAHEVRYWALGRARGAMIGEAWEGSESGIFRVVLVSFDLGWAECGAVCGDGADGSVGFLLVSQVISCHFCAYLRRERKGKVV